jgi:hypothetical protein
LYLYFRLLTGPLFIASIMLIYFDSVILLLIVRGVLITPSINASAFIIDICFRC